MVSALRLSLPFLRFFSVYTPPYLIKKEKSEPTPIGSKLGFFKYGGAPATPDELIQIFAIRPAIILLVINLAVFHK